MTGITFLSNYDDSYKPIRINKRDAKNYVLDASELCNVLRVQVSSNIKNIVMKLGEDLYTVKNINIDHVLQLLAERATNLTEVEFSQPPKKKLLQLLFDKNEIKTVKVGNSNDFWRHILNNRIENLDVNFQIPGGNNFVSFKEHFPNLKTLKLKVHKIRKTLEASDFQELLSKILPFIDKIKLLDLHLETPGQLDMVVVWEDMFKFAHLEELSFKVTIRFTIYPEFDVHLYVSCPNLRVVILEGFHITDGALCSLMLLPNLEKLRLELSKTKFLSLEQLSGMEKISEFHISYSECLSSVNMEDLCTAVKNMCELRSLYVGGLTKEQTLQIACEAIVAATSQEKDVIVNIKTKISRSRVSHKRLKIKSETVGSSDENCPILNLNIDSLSKETYSNDIQNFVQTNLQNYLVHSMTNAK